MGQRLDLQALLVSILGSKHVYFQPESNLDLEYPCIVYKRDDRATEFANDQPYMHRKRYQVTFIGQDPDSDIPEQIAALPLCRFDRHYTADNLNHDVYKLFF